MLNNLEMKEKKHPFSYNKRQWQSRDLKQLPSTVDLSKHNNNNYYYCY